MRLSLYENNITNLRNDGKRLLNSLTCALKSIPTLPHIQIKLLSLCNAAPERTDDIINIIRTDPGLCFRLLHSLHLSGRRISGKADIIVQAVQKTGINCISNMIANSADSLLSEHLLSDSESPYLNEFWQHSIRCALISESIAEETGYKYPDEAFIAGLLHDIGKLILIVKFPGIYRRLFGSHQDTVTVSELISDEEMNIGIDHSRIAAILIDQWNYNPVLADAILYHHYPIDKVNNASDLVKILYTANILAAGERTRHGQSLEKAIKLVGISGEQADKYVVSANESVSKTIRFFNMKDKNDDATEPDHSQRVWKDLFNEFRDFNLTGGMFSHLLEAENRGSILSFCKEGLGILTGLWNTHIFLYEKEQEALVPEYMSNNPNLSVYDGLSVPMNLKNSLLVSSLIKNSPLDSFSCAEESGPALIDEQIIHITGCEGIFCLPMITRNISIGTIVMGLNRADLLNLKDLMPRIRLFVRNISSVLLVEQERGVRVKQHEISSLESSAVKVRKVIHEINNPLSVIKNYLKVLGLKLEKYEISQDELRIINEEINRVGKLLKTLTVSDEKVLQEKESVNINSVIKDIIKLTQVTLSGKSGIKIHVDLDPSAPEIYSVKDNFKQIFINLLNNAIEAMPEGGEILIRTEYLREPGEWAGIKDTAGKGKIKISIMDSGSGISAEIKEKLFNPLTTSKDGHEGLGLSVVKKLVDNMNGSIWVENGTGKGACFNIQLPAQGSVHQ